jgi:hypothetical protein
MRFLESRSALVASLVVSVGVAGCGRVGFSTDASVDAVTGSDAAPGDCVAPYAMASGGCYRFVSAAAPWVDAADDCEDDAPGAHLVVIGTIAEHHTIHALSGSVLDVWLGYSDRASEGALVWVAPGGLDPTSDPCFFGATAINSATADCVTQDATTSCGDWFYRDCADAHAYVCERAVEGS